MGAAHVDGIIVDEAFNAAYTQASWRRKNFLRLGLPLFSILDPRERVALLAHGVNGDPRRGLVIGSAIRALIEWHLIMYPDFSYRSLLGIEGILMLPFNLFRWGLSSMAKLAAYGLVYLLAYDMQRAEYLADALAADVGGTDAVIALTEKLHLTKTFSLVVQKAALAGEPGNLFDELRDGMMRLPQRELERIRRVARLQGSRLDGTHPPTIYRIEFLGSCPASPPKVMLSPADWGQLERELSTLQPKVQKRLLDLYRRGLYY